jgi:hypothetical protein
MLVFAILFCFAQNSMFSKSLKADFIIKSGSPVSFFLVFTPQYFLPSLQFHFVQMCFALFTILPQHFGVREIKKKCLKMPNDKCCIFLQKKI